jgi:uroporphyrinogen decarboxylase
MKEGSVAVPRVSTMTSTFLDACGGADTPVAPVWLMRQAGRYLPEYLSVKDRYGFWGMCRTPEIAAEVTLQPVRRFALDAAILFSDIMSPLPAMGVDIDFAPGPVISEPVRDERALARLHEPEPGSIAPFVPEAIRCVLSECPVPLIGFAGSPLTLATYLVQGKGDPDYLAFRSLLREQPAMAHKLLALLTRVTIEYLLSQINAGVHAVQLFDSWAGLHDKRTYAAFGLPYVRQVLDAIGDRGVPRIYLAVGASHLYPQLAGLPVEVLSVDWRTDLTACRAALPGKVLQGNLDPAALLGSPATLTAAARQVLVDGLGGPHIFNLGHGVLLGTPPDNVAVLADFVHGFNRHDEQEQGGPA